MNDKCECGHAKDDHANHYDYHQCFILGCGCQEYTAAQQSVQADTRHAPDGKVAPDEVIPF